MPNIRISEETDEMIEEIADQFNHPSTKKWIVDESVKILYEKEVEDGT